MSTGRNKFTVEIWERSRLRFSDQVGTHSAGPTDARFGTAFRSPHHAAVLVPLNRKDLCAVPSPDNGHLPSSGKISGTLRSKRGVGQFLNLPIAPALPAPANPHKLNLDSQ